MTKSRTLHPATAAARIAPLLLALAGLAIAAGGLWLWRHRRQIAAALVAAVATAYAAGAWGRQQIEALATDSARRLPDQPVAAVAPITATIAAAWGLVDRGTMARKRAPVAQPAAQPAAQPVNLAELYDPDFSGGLTPSQHLDVLHGGADPRVVSTAAASEEAGSESIEAICERVRRKYDRSGRPVPKTFTMVKERSNA
jgi:hypothetical protein